MAPSAILLDPDLSQDRSGISRATVEYLVRARRKARKVGVVKASGAFSAAHVLSQACGHLKHDIGADAARLDLVHDNSGIERGWLAGDLAHSGRVVQDGKKQSSAGDQGLENPESAGRLDEFPVGIVGQKPIKKACAARRGSGPKKEYGDDAGDRSVQ